MIIKRLHIDSFGCLRDKDISFGEGLNQLFNENGWGKTTLAIFIKAMLYGMPASRDNVKMERRKYMPWQGGNYGGWLEFECDKGDFRITRNFAKTPEGDQIQLVDTKNNKVLPLPKEGVGEWILGVGRETFEMTAFFPQLNFLSVANEQISAGVLGLDKLKYDLSNVGDALNRIKKEISSQKKLLIKSGDIDRNFKQIAALKADLIEAEQAIIEIDKNLALQQKQREELENKIAAEQQVLNSHQKVFDAKAKIENQLKEENEKLAQLLLQANEIKPEAVVKKKPNILLVVLGLLTVFVGIGLSATSLLSWGIGGGVAGVGVVLSVLAFVFKRKEKANNSPKTKDDKIGADIEQCKQSVEQLKNLLKNYEEIHLPSSDALNYQQNLLFNTKLTLERLQAQKSALFAQKDRLVADIENMQQTGDNFSSQNEKVTNNIDLLQQTANFLAQAKENVSSRFVKPINEDINSLLQEFEMRGREYTIDTNFDIRQVTNSGLQEFEHSSQGYKDILSICMRMLLIKHVYKEDKPCVILDDSFVNLDDDNFNKAKKIIEKFSAEMQILYICCSEKMRI